MHSWPISDGEREKGGRYDALHGTEEQQSPLAESVRAHRTVVTSTAL